MKILVVDDELVSRNKLKKITNTLGECEAVESGEEALKIATSENPPDLILLDIMMPGMDGYEVCSRLKADKRTSNIPVIFISAESEEEQETKGFGLGAVDYITKPFSAAIVKARVQTHLELVKHRVHLEELVQERTIELTKTNEQLQQAQKMEALGTLAGGIAHDFNNVLYVILGYTEMVIDDMPEDSMTRTNLEEMFKAANRAKGLVQQILTFSRLGEHKRKPLRIQPIVKEALKLLRASLPSTIDIRQNIDKECGPVLADPTQIHQVMMNLCTNAYHAMHEKGGVLGVTLAEVEIGSGELGVDTDLNPGRYLKLTVSDTGYGMGRDVRDRIFEPYFTTKPPGEGTGMGLSVVHGIVKNHEGYITIFSEPGEGATFNVYLPLIDTSAVAPKSVSDEPAPTGNERILLVDDEECIVRMAQQILERLGYHVTARTSSVEALEAFRTQPEKFDLVITDMTMRNMTGDQLAQKLRDIRPDIPVILCTGFSEVITKEKAKAIGIREYVMKPVVKHEIAETIRKVLDHGK